MTNYLYCIEVHGILFCSFEVHNYQHVEKTLIYPRTANALHRYIVGIQLLETRLQYYVVSIINHCITTNKTHKTTSNQMMCSDKTRKCQ